MMHSIPTYLGLLTVGVPGVRTVWSALSSNTNGASSSGRSPLPSPRAVSGRAPSPWLGGVGAPTPNRVPLPIGDAGSARPTTDVLQSEISTLHPAAPGAWVSSLAFHLCAHASRVDALAHAAWGQTRARRPSRQRVTPPVPRPLLDKATLAHRAREGELGLSALSSASVSSPWPSRSSSLTRDRSSSVSREGEAGASVGADGGISGHEARCSGVAIQRRTRAARSAGISACDGSLARARAIWVRKSSSSSAGIAGPMQPARFFSRTCV